VSERIFGTGAAGGACEACEQISQEVNVYMKRKALFAAAAAALLSVASANALAQDAPPPAPAAAAAPHAAARAPVVTGTLFEDDDAEHVVWKWKPVGVSS
jgi:hypothetical protein